MLQSATVEEQEECEAACRRVIDECLNGAHHHKFTKIGLLDAKTGKPRLMREKHVEYLQRGLVGGLGPGYVALDASRPWICYWILHSLDLLEALRGESFSPSLVDSCCDTLQSCADLVGGGFGGGPGQLSHCAPTYAATLALCILGTDRALGLVDRRALYSFFMSVKDQQSGGFRMHVDGEVDVRGTYTVIAVAALLNILTPELSRGAAEYALSCQSYEGGFGGEPGAEAHGGYVFCAFATLVILGQSHRIPSLDQLERWVSRRQMPVEGGFQGRTNKLVDGCYSFWQGATLLLVHLINRSSAVFDQHTLEFDESALREASWEACDRDALERYILLCAQQLPDGGLRDKPGKSRDYYHTCYCLSALGVYGIADAPPVHPLFNVRSDKLRSAVAYYRSLPATHEDLLRRDE